MKFKNSIQVAFFGALLLGSSGSFAGQWCGGTINNSYTDNGGNVFILGSWRGEWTRICSLNTTLNDITPTTCKAWFSTAQTAIVTGKTVTMYYDVASCATIPSYNDSPKPTYLMLNK